MGIKQNIAGAFAAVTAVVGAAGFDSKAEAAPVTMNAEELAASQELTSFSVSGPDGVSGTFSAEFPDDGLPGIPSIGQYSLQNLVGSFTADGMSYAFEPDSALVTIGNGNTGSDDSFSFTASISPEGQVGNDPADMFFINFRQVDLIENVDVATAIAAGFANGQATIFTENGQRTDYALDSLDADPVPLPGAAVVFGTGLAVAYGARRRRSVESASPAPAV